MTDFFSKCHQIRSPNPQFPADLVTFTEKILNGELNFLCSDAFLNNFAKKSKDGYFAVDWHTLFKLLC